MTFRGIFFLIVLFWAYGIQPIWAEETDQFTLPPYELEDIGPIASRKLYYVLEQVIEQTNAEMRLYLSRANYSRHAAKQLAQRYKGTYLADLMYQHAGPGYPRFLRWQNFLPAKKPLFYKEKYPWKTIYWLVFSQSPLFVIGLAPTVHMYGYYFGTDKLNHFFMQGHTYYKMYMYFRAHGKTAKQARAAIVTYGQILEQTYLGTLINGVYSNGDLAANYAGWKFYMNLTHPIKIGENTLPPIFILKGNAWKFARHINKDDLLKPYLSDVLDEAWNPCRYSFMRNQIRRLIKRRCDSWITQKHLTPQLVNTKMKETSTWHGEPYGHWLPENNAVTLNACFGGQ